MAERVILYGTNGLVQFASARLAADNLALPTAPDVLAVMMGYDRVDANLDLLTSVADNADATTGAVNGRLVVATREFLFNTTDWDRKRNNTEGTVLASAARTATTSAADQVNYNARGVIIHFDITAVPTVETVTLTVTAKSPIDGVYETLLTGAAEVAVAKRAYLIYPGAGAAANGIDVVNGFPLPRTWRVTVTHSASGSFTYSVGYQLVL